MGTELQRHRPSTGLSPASRVQHARSTLGQPITRLSALEAGKRLVGSFANCRPGDPDQFAESVADLLMKYPAGLVDEACDPTRGYVLARDVHKGFMGLDTLYIWLEGRKADYTEIAFPRLPALEPPGDPTMAERVCQLLTGLVAALRGRNEPSPLDVAIAERTDGRRLRLEEVKRRAAEAPLSRAPYKPLCDWKYRPSKSEPA